jgi:hypothetical protein
MNLDDLVTEMVEERSLEALEMLTGTKNDEVLEALINAAGRLIRTDSVEENDDGIVDTIRQHLVETKPVGLLMDALQSSDGTTREFALSVLGEIGDAAALPAMINLLQHKDPGTREAAAEHLALLTSYDFGTDVAKWRAWHDRKIKGLEDQAVEDAEDKQRMTLLQIRGKRGKAKQADGDDNDDDGYSPSDRARFGVDDDDDDDRPRRKAAGDDDDEDGGRGARRDDDDDF